MNQSFTLCRPGTIENGSQRRWKAISLHVKSDTLRSLVTVAALATAGNTKQLTFHLGLAQENGVTATELTEAITHLAFYAGWPRAMSAMAVAKQVLGETPDEK